MPVEPAFDYVFLDADKAGYPDYYEEIITRLLPGGLLLIDNVLLGGGVTAPQEERERIMDALNDRVTADERVDSAMVLVADAHVRPAPLTGPVRATLEATDGWRVPFPALWPAPW